MLHYDFGEKYHLSIKFNVGIFVGMFINIMPKALLNTEYVHYTASARYYPGNTRVFDHLTPMPSGFRGFLLPFFSGFHT